MLHLYAGLGLLAITLKEGNGLNRFCQVASFSVFTVIERKSSKECSIGKQTGMLCNVLHSHCKTYARPKLVAVKKEPEMDV